MLATVEQANVTCNETRTWYLDSGPTCHVTCRQDWLHNYVDLSSKETQNLLLGDNFQVQDRRLRYSSARHNLLSTARIAKKGCQLHIDMHGCQVTGQQGRTTLQAEARGDMLVVDLVESTRSNRNHRFRSPTDDSDTPERSAEYTGKNVAELLREHAIIHETVAAHTPPEHNGVAERFNRPVVLDHGEVHAPRQRTRAQLLGRGTHDRRRHQHSTDPPRPTTDSRPAPETFSIVFVLTLRPLPSILRVGRTANKIGGRCLCGRCDMVRRARLIDERQK